MNYSRQSNQAPSPAIRAGLSVQELKAMTAMRMATNEPNRNNISNNNMNTTKFPPVNPASSYQTATPQQLQAAGIQPLVLNDRQQLGKPRLQKQNSQPLFGAGLSNIEDNSFYTRPSNSSLSGLGLQSSGKYGGQQSQQQTLSPYHQQILVGGRSQIAKQQSGEFSLYGSGASSYGSRAEQLQQQSMQFRSQNSLQDAPLGRGGLYSQQQALMEEQEDDLFFERNRLSQSQYGQQSLQSQRLLPVGQTAQQQRALDRRLAAQEQYSLATSDDEADYALNSMLANYERSGLQQQRNPVVSVPPGFVGSGQLNSEEDALYDFGRDAIDRDFFGRRTERSERAESSESGTGAFSDSFTELSLHDRQAAVQQAQQHSQHFAGTVARKLGTINKSQSQPLIPLNLPTSLSPLPGRGSHQLNPINPGPFRPASMLLPELELSPHTSRENTPKHVTGRASPQPQYSPQYISESTQQQSRVASGLYGNPAQQQTPTSGSHFPLIKSKTQSRLLGAMSPLNSPAMSLFPRKHFASLDSPGTGLPDGMSEDYLASEMAMSVLDLNTPLTTPGAQHGKGFNFTKDVNEFRLNSLANTPGAASHKTLLPGISTNDLSGFRDCSPSVENKAGSSEGSSAYHSVPDSHNPYGGKFEWTVSRDNDLDDSLSAVMGDWGNGSDMGNELRKHNNNNEDDDVTAELGAFSRASSDSFGQFLATPRNMLE